MLQLRIWCAGQAVEKFAHKANCAIDVKTHFHLGISVVIFALVGIFPVELAEEVDQLVCSIRNMVLMPLVGMRASMANVFAQLFVDSSKGRGYIYSIFGENPTNSVQIVEERPSSLAIQVALVREAEPNEIKMIWAGDLSAMPWISTCHERALASIFQDCVKLRIASDGFPDYESDKPNILQILRADICGIKGLVLQNRSARLLWPRVN